MLIYKRNIQKKLISLRGSFVILGTTCFYAFINNVSNLIYFSSLIIITLSILVIKDFVIFQSSLQITKFYFFGLIKKEWHFGKNENIQLKSDSSSFGDEGDISNFDSEEAATVGCLFSIYGIFFPPQISSKEFTIEVLSYSKKVIKRVHIFLNKKEFNFLQALIS